MAGFFVVTDIPSRRVVQYKRVAHTGDDVIYIEDESILGDPINEMPYADKTGLAVTSGYFGMVYELPYLPDAGDVYIATQPKGGVVGVTLSVSVKAGKSPYAIQWLKDGQIVINVPSVAGKLTASEPGEYFCVVKDANGAEAVSQAVTVTEEAK